MTVRCEDPQGTQIIGIASQLRQAIAHLLSNAIDAVPVGGKVSMEAKTDGDWVRIVVTDDGSGMSPAQQELVFQPFHSTKGDLGNGLGLYITREIVDRHKGSIQIESTPGRGTIVLLKLPSAGRA